MNNIVFQANASVTDYKEVQASSGPCGSHVQRPECKMDLNIFCDKAYL